MVLQVTGCYYRAMLAQDKADQAKAVSDLHASFKTFEDNLAQRGTKFFFGNKRPGLMDYMIWPWFERMDTLERVKPAAEMKKKQFPKLVSFPTSKLVRSKSIYQ